MSLQERRPALLGRRWKRGVLQHGIILANPYLDGMAAGQTSHYRDGRFGDNVCSERQGDLGFGFDDNIDSEGGQGDLGGCFGNKIDSEGQGDLGCSFDVLADRSGIHNLGEALTGDDFDYDEDDDEFKCQT